jgi:hypothetical protein
MQRAGPLNSRTPASPLPSSLVADPAKETLKELSRDLIVAVGRILSDVETVPKKERGEEVSLVPARMLGVILPIPMFLYPVKPSLGLRAVSPLSET